MNYCMFTIAAFAAATFAACAAAEAADFQIGVYCLKENARTEQHIKDIAPRFMEFRSVDTRLVGFEKHPDWLKGSDSTSVAALDGGFFRQLKAEDGDALVIGIMTDQRGVPARKALYVVAAEDPWDESPKVRTVSFEGAGKVTAFAANGPVPLRRTADGRRYAFDLKSNGAVLVVFEM